MRIPIIRVTPKDWPTNNNTWFQTPNSELDNVDQLSISIDLQHHLKQSIIIIN